ncbi:hypothetical protein GCM10010446_15660 [Streptomyces enissocaesilis]|uniref:Uncharacterized protein n=1 Tax=Streptomyces enissocaesilis TaxID=332589 RepID=A0ABN3WYB5_9ACTN
MLRPREGERPRRKRETASGRPAITPERQPLATRSRNLLDRPRRCPAETPLSTAGAIAAGRLGGDPRNRGTDWLSGGAVLDRAWPIVVHSQPVHKWFITH